MKRLTLLCAVLALGGCAMFKHPAAQQAVAATKPQPTLDSNGQPIVRVDGVPIERVAFRVGVSSATVEEMARAAQCTGGLGAGLVSEPGPVEVYRMRCDDGRTFMARCELRQCQPMKQ